MRKEIAESIQKKDSQKFDFTQVIENGFEFVKCSNWKVRRPDGDLMYDGKLIKQSYGGSVYVRLNSSLPFKKASSLYVFLEGINCMLLIHI